MSRYETRIKQLEYHVPAGAKEMGWAALVLWRNPKDGHRRIVAPWGMSADITPQDRRTLHRFSKALSECIDNFAKSERARETKRRTK